MKNRFSLMTPAQLQCQMYGKGYGLCALDAFRMVVCAGCRLFCIGKHTLFVGESPPYGTHSHRRSIAIRPIGLWLVASHPRIETASIATHRVWIAPAPFMERRSVALLMHYGICHGDSADGIVGKVVLVGKQLEIIIIGGEKLPTATDNVADYRS